MSNLRKFSNIRLTAHFHFRHMVLWVLVSVSLLVLVNLLLYFLANLIWGYGTGMEGESMGDSSGFRTGLIIGLGLETLLLSAAMVLLAKTTSHRIAGPYLKLQSTCERISNGERDLRLHFRTYDGLEKLESAFNVMLEHLYGSKPDKRG